MPDLRKLNFVIFIHFKIIISFPESVKCLLFISGIWTGAADVFRWERAGSTACRSAEEFLPCGNCRRNLLWAQTSVSEREHKEVRARVGSRRLIGFWNEKIRYCADLDPRWTDHSLDYRTLIRRTGWEVSFSTEPFTRLSSCTRIIMIGTPTTPGRTARLRLVSWLMPCSTDH